MDNAVSISTGYFGVMQPSSAEKDSLHVFPHDYSLFYNLVLFLGTLTGEY